MRSPSLSRFFAAATVLTMALGLAGQARADQNLVVNGSFATGDFTGFTLSGDTGQVFVAGNPNIGSPSMFAAALTTSSAVGTLSQSLNTVAGQEYTVSFMLQGDGATPNMFSATLGTTPLVTLTDVPATPAATTYTFDYTATASPSVLAFNFRDDPGYLYLTGISVVPFNAVPEPPAVIGLGMGGLILAGYLWRQRRRPGLVRAA